MAKLSYAHGASDVPLLGETIGENLRKTVARHGEREALVVRSQGFRASHGELWARTTELAKALMASGIAKGDRVAICEHRSLSPGTSHGTTVAMVSCHASCLGRRRRSRDS